MLALLGLLLILSSSFVRGIWRVRVRPFYRKPDAIEPSSLGFRVRSAALLGTGLVALAFSIVQIVAITDEGVGSTAGPDAGERCSDLAAQVGHPPSLSKAEDAISDAAGGSMATRWIAKRCPRTRRSGPGGGCEVTLTMTTTTWTVTSDQAEIAHFRWTAGESEGIVEGKFGNDPCAGIGSHD